MYKQDGLLVVGKWNAKMGNSTEENVIALYGSESKNEVGEWLTHFCIRNGIVIANTSSNQSLPYIHGHHQMEDTDLKPIILLL